MAASKRKIPLARLEPGSVLAESVVRDDGQVLMTAGTSLDEEKIEVLRSRGVALVTVDDGSTEDAGEAPSVDADALKASAVEAAAWFGEVRNDPIMAQVFRWAVVQGAKKGS